MKVLLVAMVALFGMNGMAQCQIVERGFLYDTTVPPTCHAATVAETPKGELIAVFFGGSYEGHPDSNEWICRRTKNSAWSEPEILTEGVRNKYTEKAFDYDTVQCDRKPCYNPVLYVNAKGGLVLDYKIGRNMQDWTGWEMTSRDGRKWTHPRPLANTPEERHLTLGPIKNKPIVSQGRIIAGSSTEVTYDSWKVHFEISDNDGKDWRKVEVNCDTILCIQPAILDLGNGHLKALCRTRHHRIAMTESFDNGSSWTDMRLTDIPNNNSGIDAVTLRDGRHLLVGNLHGNDARRSPITLAISSDGDNWTNLLDLEEDDGMEYSYPCIIETSDGRIVVLYTWHRQKIAYAILSLSAQTLPSAKKRAVYGMDSYVSASKYDYSEIAKKITADATTKYDKAKALYLWLCENVEYDRTAQSRTADDCWDNRKAVCQGYCELFYRMAETVGLKSHLVFGRTKVRDEDSFEEHTWLSVKTEQGDILVDPTWGAGGFSKGRFVRLRNPLMWFDVDPYLFVFTHMPKKKKYQYIEKTITEEQFVQLPFVTPRTKLPDASPQEILQMVLDGSLLLEEQ